MTTKIIETGAAYLLARANRDHRIADTLAEINEANMRRDTVARDQAERMLNDLAFGWREAGVPLYTGGDVLTAAAEIARRS